MSEHKIPSLPQAVITWNVLHPSDKYQQIAQDEKRIDRVIELIATKLIKNKIICLQEFPVDRLADLKNKVGKNYNISTQQYGAFKETSLLIVISHHRYPIETIEFADLNKTNWRCLSVVFDCNTNDLTGCRFQIINTHLKGGQYGRENRAQFFADLYGIIKERSVVVCGDFNTNFESPSDRQCLRQFVSSGFLLDQQNLITEPATKRKLDHFLFRNYQVNNEIVATTNLSDHCCLQLNLDSQIHQQLKEIKQKGRASYDVEQLFRHRQRIDEKIDRMFEPPTKKKNPWISFGFGALTGMVLYLVVTKSRTKNR